MTTVSFPSAGDYDVVELELRKPDGTLVPMRLLVDSGFTGESSLVLSAEAAEFALAEVSAAHTAGALRGRQARALVTCRIPALSFERHLIAIIADVSSLAFPRDVAGMVGLNFLRQFARWGGQRTRRGDWEFFLESAT